eukprot:6393613-Amphidinium_carterae.1
MSPEEYLRTTTFYKDFDCGQESLHLDPVVDDSSRGWLPPSPHSPSTSTEIYFDDLIIIIIIIIINHINGKISHSRHVDHHVSSMRIKGPLHQNQHLGATLSLPLAT